jgi:hypothetical protein
MVLPVKIIQNSGLQKQGIKNARVYHDHDPNNLEVDAVVQKHNGDWSAFEIESGIGQIDEAAASRTQNKRLYENLFSADSNSCPTVCPATKPRHASRMSCMPNSSFCKERKLQSSSNVELYFP